MCFFSSLPYLADELENDVKFYLALVGQALTGVACPFISCVPTKISQHWYEFINNRSKRLFSVTYLLLFLQFSFPNNSNFPHQVRRRSKNVGHDSVGHVESDGDRARPRNHAAHGTKTRRHSDHEHRLVHSGRSWIPFDNVEGEFGFY